MRFTGFTGLTGWLHRGVVAAIVVALLAAVAVAVRFLLVDAGHSPRPAESSAVTTQSQRVLTPGDHGLLNAVVTRLLGGAKCEKLSHTHSEVWTIPQAKLASLEERLVSLGVKFALLREDWNHILRRDKTPVSPQQEEQLTKAKGPETVGAGLMRAPGAAVAEYALTETPEQGNSRLIVPLSDEKQVTLVRTSVRRTDKGVIWRGTVADTGETAILQWWKDGRLNGLFGYRGHIYTVMNMGGDLHAVLEVDPKRMPKDHPTILSADARHNDALSATMPDFPPPTTKVEMLSPEQLNALEAKKVVIDVMMLYTKRAASHYMLEPEDVLELIFERINDTFRNSGIGNVSIRLVHAQEVDYNEQGSEEFIDLYHMVDGDGPFKDVRRLRDEKHADIVGLLVDDPRGCGLSTRVAPDADEAYFVVHYSCAVITVSIAHEIGHILGVRHDRLVDSSDSPFPYGHGYVNGTKWRDIMSYAESCDGCLRIPYWSNPRMLYKGEPTGTLTEDAARVILEQAERVSQFR
jgi:Metallo-peptidase family M12